MKTIIHCNPSFQLYVDLEPNKYSVSLKLITFVPTARRPEEQVKFQANLSLEELKALHRAIEKVLPKPVASATI